MQTPRGQKWAILGVAVAALATAWAYVEVREVGPCGSVTSSCVNNLNVLGKAMELYSMAWDDHLPVLHTRLQRAPKDVAWSELLMPYLRKLGSSSSQPSASDEKRCRKYLMCPGSPRDRLTYAFNRCVSGRKLSHLYDSEDYSDSGRNTILLYDTLSDSPRNNNLNGDSTWTPGDGPPRPGVLPLWNGSSSSPPWGWPKWARSRHQGNSVVVCVDGHVITVREPQFDPEAQADE